MKEVQATPVPRKLNLTEMQIEGIENIPKINYFSLCHYRGTISGDVLYEDDHILIKIKGDNVIFWYDDKVDGHIRYLACHKDIIGKIVYNIEDIK